MGRAIDVRIVREPRVGWTANYGNGALCLNLGKLGHRWFDEPDVVEVLDLLIHEFGHEYESDHLSEGYYKALTRLGAKAVKVALEKPRFFDLAAPHAYAASTD